MIVVVLYQNTACSTPAFDAYMTLAFQKKYPLPLKKVVTSPAFLAILVAHTSGAWGFYVLLIEIPFYMEAVLNFHINESAFLATLPFLVHWVFSVFLGKSMDYLRVKGTITTTFARKFCTFIALGVSSGKARIKII